VDDAVITVPAERSRVVLGGASWKRLSICGRFSLSEREALTRPGRRVWVKLSGYYMRIRDAVKQDMSGVIYLMNRLRREAMKLSARNVLKGTVKRIIPGAVNSEVVIVTAGGEEIVSVITKESVESLGLEEGKEVYAVIKASNVMVAVD
jgi:molybdopterin-binding protein